MATFTNQATLTYGDVSVASNIATGVVTAILTATKSSIEQTYNAGSTLTYTVSLVNSGTNPLTGVTVTDNLGSNTSGTLTVVPLTYVTGTLQYYQNGVLQATPTIATTNPLKITGITIPAGGNVLFIYKATVNQYANLATGSTITNTVTASSSAITPITATNKVTVAYNANLSIVKSICPNPVVENSPVTYTFVIYNSGNAAATGVVLNDTFNPILTGITVTLNGSSWASTNYTYSETTGVFTTTGTITVPPATITKNPTTGVVTTTPGSTVITVNGTI